MYMASELVNNIPVTPKKIIFQKFRQNVQTSRQGLQCGIETFINRGSILSYFSALQVKDISLSSPVLGIRS